MSLISSFKRALGFPGEFENEEEDLENEDLTDDDLIDDPDPALDELNAEAEITAGLTTPETQAPPVSDEEYKTMAADIFDAVLKYFNSYQPELVQRCLDIDAQRTMLVRELDQSLRNRLVALADRACRSGENRWAEKQKRMGEELLKLKSEYNNIRQQREEYQSAQLSATRQKRALNERISDLESQVTSLEAEREQYQLENRSMAKRLRALDGSGKQDFPIANDAADSKLQEENKALQQQIETLKSTLEQNKEEISSLNEQLKQTQSESSTPTLSQEEIEELKEIRKQMGALRQAKELSESYIIRLNKEIKDCGATINRLQKQLADSAIKVEEQKAEIESLNSTIEANISAHSQAETELRRQLSELKGEPFTIEPISDNQEVTTSRTDNKRRNKRKRKPSGKRNDEHNENHVKISAIDELMDNTDWFVAPEPVPLKKDPEVEENFGYKEPVKKQDNPDDDRQLTLW